MIGVIMGSGGGLTGILLGDSGCYPAVLNMLNQGRHSRMQPTEIEAIWHPGDTAGSRFQSRRLFARYNLPLRRCLVTVVVLASIALAWAGDSVREQSLTKRIFCNCGCREVLSECSHVECNARTPLKREIASAILQGKSDDRILGDLGTKYGAAILVVPAFRGFDALLWIVPIAAAAIALVVFIWRRWSAAASESQ